MLGKGLESLIPSGGYKKPEEQAVSPVPQQPLQQQPVYQPQQPQFQPQYQQPQQPAYVPPAPAPTTVPEQPAYQPPQPVYQPPASLPTEVPVTPPSNPQPFVPNYGVTPQPVSVEQYGAVRPGAGQDQETAAPFATAPVPAFPPEREIVTETQAPGYYGGAHPYSSKETEDYSSKQDAVFQIEVEKIFPNPHQPRRYFDENALNDLANSIREFGIIQPLVVTKVLKETENGTDVNYQLIAGERRLMAAKKVGLRTVPAVIKQVAMDRERLELAIIENIQRENLNPLEAARSYSRLQDEFGLTQREIAIRMGKSRETIANALRLLNLPSEIQRALEEGKINESHARLLLQVTDQAKQREMFNSILHFKPSVRELKARLKQDKEGFIPSGVGYANPELVSLQSRLEETLGTRVQISDEGAKGKIMISYYSPEELNDLINKLSGGSMY